MLHANLIFATCDVKNAASKRVLEKASFKLVSRIDNHMEMKGRIRDSFRFEVLREKDALIAEMLRVNHNTGNPVQHPYGNKKGMGRILGGETRVRNIKPESSDFSS